jgi:hypothetical protein
LSLRRIVLIAAAAVLVAASLLAQEPPEPTPSPTPVPGAEHLLRIIELQQQQLEEQKKLIAEQQRRLEEMQRTLESVNRRLAELEARTTGEQAPAALEARLKQLETSVTTKPELPPDVVSAGDFPGSFRIPGSDAAMKIGGWVWSSMVQTFDALGSDDRFLTYSIPVEGTPEAGKGERLSLWAGPSKFNFDVRTPTELGQMRAFIETDFGGENKTLRLRHAYGQYAGLIVGQTWSTFSDPDADHEDIDFEGLNAENVQRQAQVRYTMPLRDDLRLALAIEYPTASITGGQAVNQVPDLVGRLVRRIPDGHLQASAVIRQVRGELETQPNVVETVTAWGLSGSGVVPMRRWDQRDRLIFQVNAGKGIARYINDLNSAGGQDAVFDPVTGDLTALFAYGAYVAYEHHWEFQPNIPSMPFLNFSNLRSSLILGHVNVHNLGIQDPTAYDKTNRLSLNLLWSPIPRVDLGTQFIYGNRQNKDGSQGSARQLQLRVRFFF